MIDDLYKKYVDERIKDIFKNTDTIAPNFDMKELIGFNSKSPYEYFSEYDFAKVIKTKDGSKGLLNKFGFYIAQPIYEEIEIMSDGKIKVFSKNGDNKYYYLSENGEELFKDGFDDIGEFHDGFAPVKKNGVWFYIDEEGNNYFKGEFDETFEFRNGFAIVKKGEKYNFVNTKMKLVCDEWYDRVTKFSEGYAIVGKLEKKKGYRSIYGCHVIDSSGRRIGDKHIGECYEGFENGYAIIRGEDSLYYYIKKDGKIAFGQGFCEADSFKNGMAFVYPNNKGWSDTYRRGYLFEDGRILAPDKFIELEKLDDEDNENFYLDDNAERDIRNRYRFIAIKKPANYTYKGSKIHWLNHSNYYDIVEKKVVLHEWFSERHRESDPVEIIEGNDGKFNFFNKKTGELAFSEWLDKVEEYKYIVRRDKKYNVYNRYEGKLASEIWFDYVEEIFNTNYYMVRLNRLWNIIDSDGNYLFNQWSSTPIDIDGIYSPSSPNFVTLKKSILPDYRFHDAMPYNRRLFCITKDLNNYTVIHNMSKSNYTCYNGDDSFEIDYEPVVIYDSNNVLCVRKDNKDAYKREGELCLFNRINRLYRRLGSISDVRFLKNMIFDSKNQRVYMVYDGEVLDISEYYKNNLVGKAQMYIRNNVHILSKEEFKEKFDEIKDIISKNVKQGHNLTEFFKEVANQLGEIAKKEGVLPKTDLGEYLLAAYGDNLEIRKEIIDSGLLKYIDLSSFNFDNDGVDFSDVPVKGVK